MRPSCRQGRRFRVRGDSAALQIDSPGTSIDRSNRLTLFLIRDAQILRQLVIHPRLGGKALGCIRFKKRSIRTLTPIVQDLNIPSLPLFDRSGQPQLNMIVSTRGIKEHLRIER